jgi:hypothetical protein
MTLKPVWIQKELTSILGNSKYTTDFYEVYCVVTLAILFFLTEWNVGKGDSNWTTGMRESHFLQVITYLRQTVWLDLSQPFWRCNKK